MFSTQGVVGGLCGLSNGITAFGSRHRALKPLLGISIPALVNNPIFINSLRLNRAATNSRLFFAAIFLSFSLVLSLFEIYAIAFSPFGFYLQTCFPE
jgi:hypothetical protein